MASDKTANFNGNNTMLSVIVITKNESSHIARCLGSVTWADEIIVLDSGSTDNTVDICKSFTPHVFSTDWPGYGPQKQRALEKARGDWVLSLDADEYISDNLKHEILNHIQSNDACGYKTPRLSSFCGKQMKHGGWWPDYVLRLFQRNKGHFSNDNVHEHVIVEGTIKKLENPILHETYVNLEEALTKMNSYSSLGAEKLFNKGKKSSFFLALFKGAWSFFNTYFIKAAFLDGSHGLLLAINTAEYTFYKYMKLYFINK